MEKIRTTDEIMKESEMLLVELDKIVYRLTANKPKEDIGLLEHQREMKMVVMHMLKGSTMTYHSPSDILEINDIKITMDFLNRIGISVKDLQDAAKSAHTSLAPSATISYEPAEPPQILKDPHRFMR